MEEIKDIDSLFSELKTTIVKQKCLKTKTLPVLATKA